jgi:hypothetical protein
VAVKLWSPLKLQNFINHNLMKYLFAIMAVLILALSIAVPSFAGPGRPSFSSRSSYSGGFRSSSSSSYRSFSSSPSRSFSFRSSPSTSTYSRPAAAPRSYTYSAPKSVVATPVSRSTVKRTVITNHYHGDGGHSSSGGFGLGDALMFHALTSHNNSPTYINTQPVVAGGAYSQPIVANDGYQDGPAMIYQREESHFWRNTFLIIVGIAFFYGVYLFYKSLLADYKKSV